MRKRETEERKKERECDLTPGFSGSTGRSSENISADLGARPARKACNEREQRTPLSDISRAIFCDLSVAHHRRRRRRRRHRRGCYAWSATKRKLLLREQPIPVASRYPGPVAPFR